MYGTIGAHQMSVPADTLVKSYNLRTFY